MTSLCLRRALAGLLLAAFALGALAPASAQTLRERLGARRGGEGEPLSLVHAGQTRLYRVHVPAGLTPGQPVPLVIALHGGGGNMDVQANDRFYGWISQAERSGFIVVFPNGFSRLPGGQLATWNAGGCCGAARDQGSDDVGFIRALVAQLKGRYAIDGQRIFATGMSNGGMMAYRLACEMADTVRAVAAVAGTDNTRKCTPSRPVAVLHIHARDDDHVPFDGGLGPRSLTRAEHPHASVPDTLARWRSRDACPDTPPRTVLDTPGARCELSGPCRDASVVQACITERGGHSWPGGTQPRGHAEPSTALDATPLIWNFFASLPARP
ncbi:PHB depolymerase family esterase [Ideonella sp. DXS22W]|uniref:PHB depolymerase family esterase n=1 Tax=Pseudaquabacterium inlustre TaxID=2984192 RepID=A0ABU9CMZ1_9BURK